MSEYLLVGLALVLVIEGLLPFISPKGYRKAALDLARMPDNQIRLVGFSLMLLGVIVLYLVH